MKKKQADRRKNFFTLRNLNVDAEYYLLLLFAFVASVSSTTLSSLKVSYVVGGLIMMISFTRFRSLKTGFLTKLLVSTIFISATYAWIIGGFEGPALYIGILASTYLGFISIRQLGSRYLIEKYLFFFQLGFNLSNILVTVFLLVFVQFRDFVISSDQYGIRLTGFFLNANAFASAQLLILPLSFYFLLKVRWVYKPIYLFFLINGAFLLVASQSRFAYIGIFLASLIVFFIKIKVFLVHSKNLFYKTMSVFGILIAIGILTYFVGIATLDKSLYQKSGLIFSRFNPKNRISSTKITLKDFQGERLQILKASAETLLDNPFGIGYQPHEKVIGEETGVYKVAHNFIISQLLYYGLFFGTIWVLLWLYPIFKGYRILNKARRLTWDLEEFVFIGYTSYLIYSLGHSSTNWVYLWLYFVILLLLLNRFAEDKQLQQIQKK